MHANRILGTPLFQQAMSKLARRTDASGGPDACWVFRKRPARRYESIRVTIEGRRYDILVHQLAWVAANGRMPSSGGKRTFCVLHSCDNTTCVNPKHLSLGTDSDNVADMVAKNRQAKGERNANAVLNAEAVVHIRSSAASTATLAEKYGVHQTTIDRVRSKETWAHVKVAPLR